MEFEGQEIERTVDDELLDAIREINSLDDEDSEVEVDEEVDSDVDESVEETEDSEEDEEVEEEIEDEEEIDEEEAPAKKPQSKEENARFARERREREMQAKIDAALEQQRQESAEFKLAKTLAEQYGTTPEALLEQMKEAELVKQAEKENVPIERLRREQELSSKLAEQEARINQLMFSQWQTQMDVEKSTLGKEYTMLDQKDMDAAVDYMLNELKNPNVPLKSVVNMLYGDKIIEGKLKAAEQEVLAKQSGRSKKPLAPMNGKPSSTATLTDEEKYVARQMGISDEEYIKFK